MFFVFYLVKYKKEVVIRKMELRELELGVKMLIMLVIDISYF